MKKAPPRPAKVVDKRRKQLDVVLSDGSRQRFLLVPAKAQTRRKSVDLGKWKLVRRTSTTWKGKPGKMKRLVQASDLRTCPCKRKTCSRTRVEVLPTDTTRRPPLFCSRIRAALSLPSR